MCARAMLCAKGHLCNIPVMCRRTCKQQPCNVQKNTCAATMTCAEHVCNIPVMHGSTHAASMSCAEEHCAAAMSYTEAHVCSNHAMDISTRVQQPCHVRKNISHGSHLYPLALISFYFSLKVLSPGAGGGTW